jgi:RimJ/RimL family protein N-acetyltransferase
MIETERLHLRPFTIDDADCIYRLNLDPGVIKMTGDIPFESVQDATNFLRAYDHYRKYGFGRWAVINRKDGEFVGWCGLKYTPEHDEVDVGFRFFRSAWNQGFATESARACVRHGFDKLNLPRVVGRAMKENIASVRVLEKIGMRFLDTFDFDGHDGVIYCIERQLRVRPANRSGNIS